MVEALLAHGYKEANTAFVPAPSAVPCTRPFCTQSFILVWEGKSFRALWFYSGPEQKSPTMGSVDELVLWEETDIHDNLNALSRFSTAAKKHHKKQFVNQKLCGSAAGLND